MDFNLLCIDSLTEFHAIIELKTIADTCSEDHELIYFVALCLNLYTPHHFHKLRASVQKHRTTSWKYQLEPIET